MATLPLFLSAVAALVTPTTSLFFQSRDASVRSVIQTCSTQVESGRRNCYEMLGCVIDRLPSTYAARWSAGASILAFTPTIVGLMSNSIQEVAAVAEESSLLATLLCVSSVTAFSSRFEDRDADGPLVLRDKCAFRHQSAVEDIADVIRANKPKGAEFWRDTRLQNLCAGVVLVGLSAGTWYEVYQITRYGIITFACDVKVNVGLWVGLAQLLALLNIGLRHHLFDVREIYFRSQTKLPRKSSPGILVPAILLRLFANPEPQSTTWSSNSQLLSVLKESHIQTLTLVLRSRRSTQTRWILQTATAIASYALYTYGTVVLASLTMIPAPDAVRAVVVLSVGAGFGRLVGYWSVSQSRTGRRRVIVNVPPAHLDALTRVIVGDGAP
jgi:hypothetical protein